MYEFWVGMAALSPLCFAGGQESVNQEFADRVWWERFESTTVGVNYCRRGAWSVRRAPCPWSAEGECMHEGCW